MRVLWLKTELLHPVDKGGKIRTYEMLKRIREGHDVTYLTLVDPADPPEAFALASEYCHRVVPIPTAVPPKFSAGFYCDLLAGAGSPLPYAVRKYRSSAMRSAIVRELEREAVDVVVCDFLAPSVNVPEQLAPSSVLFQHNVESTIWRRHAEAARGALKRSFFRDQWRKMETYERAACRRFDAVVAVSREDRDHFRDAFGVERVFDVPTGVDAEFFRPMGAEPASAELVFTGSMDWIPNEDAILWFAHEVLPRVAQSVPDVRLTVVGRNPSAPIVALGEANPRVSVTGRVDDVRPYVDRAAAYVVPIRIGGGTRLKIYEAMAMEKPVVSTTVGAEGLPVEHGRDLLVADTPDAFAAATVRLLEDRALASRIGSRAREIVRERFSWERAAEAFMDVCAGAAELRRASRPRGLARATSESRVG